MKIRTQIAIKILAKHYHGKIESINDIFGYSLIDIDDVNKGKINVRLKHSLLDDMVKFVEDNKLNLNNKKDNMLFDLNFSSELNEIVESEMIRDSGEVTLVKAMSPTSNKKKRRP